MLFALLYVVIMNQYIHIATINGDHAVAGQVLHAVARGMVWITNGLLHTHATLTIMTMPCDVDL